MRKLILSLIAALGLSMTLAGCAAPAPPSRDDAMRKLSGNYAMIYGGSYEAATSLIGSARVLMPGKITLGNESGTASFGERTRFIEWPTVELWSASTPGGDVILLLGPEPALRWRLFTEQVVGVATELGVSMVITLGALLADVLHTRPAQVDRKSVV